MNTGNVRTLTCPRCASQMRVISVIEDEEVIEEILKNLDLWETKARPPPKVTVPPLNLRIDYSDSQLPLSEDYLYIDVDYPIEADI